LQNVPKLLAKYPVSHGKYCGREEEGGSWRGRDREIDCDKFTT